MDKGEKRTRTRVAAAGVLSSVILFVIAMIAGAVILQYAYSKYLAYRVLAEEKRALAEAAASVRVYPVFSNETTITYYAVASRPVTLAVNATTYIYECNPACVPVPAASAVVDGETYYLVQVVGHTVFSTSPGAAIRVAGVFNGEYVLGEVVAGG